MALYPGRVCPKGNFDMAYQQGCCINSDLTFRHNVTKIFRINIQGSPKRGATLFYSL